MEKQDILLLLWKNTVLLHSWDEQEQLVIVSNCAIEAELTANDWYLDTFLTNAEKLYIGEKGQLIQRLAVRIAAKLAYMLTQPELEFHQIDILPNSKSEPILYQHGKVVETMKISLSHTEKYSGAFLKAFYF